MALQANNYDLLITDNNMPRMSGVELIHKLRSEGVNLPVILVSGTIPAGYSNGDPRSELAAMLLKPFTADELLGTIKAALRGTERAREQIEPRPAWHNQRSAPGLRVC
jgi:DNA-binding response OmpR family regulator